MWNYEKRLQYPVNIKTPNAKIAQIIMSQYGGPNPQRIFEHLFHFFILPYPKSRKRYRSSPVPC